MNEEEIKEKGYEKVGTNLYKKDGHFFAQKAGKMVLVKQLSEKDIRTISDYSKYQELKEDERKDDVQEVETEQVDEKQTEQIKESQLVEKEQSGGLMELSGSIDAIAELYDKYDKLKRKILTDNDTTEINGRPFTKKSGWRKIACAFNISDKLVSKEKEELENGEVRYIVEVKAEAPNGRFAFGLGMCSSDEKGKSIMKGNNKEHDILATAHTRAKNRAISDLLGGEVSAEEVTRGNDHYN